jgi:hypothetical protein
MSIIGINGKIGVGKDTVGSIIQYLTSEYRDKYNFIEWQDRVENYGSSTYSPFEIKKFAGKLKTIASLLTGIPIEKFEDQDFKKQVMSKEWIQPKHYNCENYDIEDGGGNCSFCSCKEKEMTYREFLQKLGTEAMRDGLHKEVWVNALFADYKTTIPVNDEHFEHVSTGHYTLKHDVTLPNWIITDMRFPNEMEAVVERKGITIRVVRPKIESVVDKMRPYSDLVHYGIPMPVEHPSETALDDAEFDYEIINDGSIKDLIEKVKQILITEKII